MSELSAQGTDRSGGVVQVLGTPQNDVTFTSWHDDSIGGDTDGVHPGASGGDWGGIVYRSDSDYTFEYSEHPNQPRNPHRTQQHQNPL